MTESSTVQIVVVPAASISKVRQKYIDYTAEHIKTTDELLTNLIEVDSALMATQLNQLNASLNASLNAPSHSGAFCKKILSIDAVSGNKIRIKTGKYDSGNGSVLMCDEYDAARNFNFIDRNGIISSIKVFFNNTLIEEVIPTTSNITLTNFNVVPVLMFLTPYLREQLEIVLDIKKSGNITVSLDIIRYIEKIKKNMHDKDIYTKIVDIANLPNFVLYSEGVACLKFN